MNTLSTLAFVVAGGVVAKRSRAPWVAYALVATGVGSFLFHGPMPGFSEWAHDVTLVWLLLVVAGLGRSWEKWTQLPGLTAIAVVLAIWPNAGDPLTVVFAILAIGLLLLDDRSLDTVGPAALLAAVAIIGRLGATGGPLCDPDSLLQPHALFHVGSAAAVAWWAVRRHPRATPSATSASRVPTDRTP